LSAAAARRAARQEDAPKFTADLKKDKDQGIDESLFSQVSEEYKQRNKVDEALHPETPPAPQSVENASTKTNSLQEKTETLHEKPDKDPKDEERLLKEEIKGQENAWKAACNVWTLLQSSEARRDIQVKVSKEFGKPYQNVIKELADRYEESHGDPEKLRLYLKVLPQPPESVRKVWDEALQFNTSVEKPPEVPPKSVENGPKVPEVPPQSSQTPPQSVEKDSKQPPQSSENGPRNGEVNPQGANLNTNLGFNPHGSPIGLPQTLSTNDSGTYFGASQEKSETFPTLLQRFMEVGWCAYRQKT